ncbi:MAG: AAA family ATPase [Planctomycetes bacterium]|nr:AAA family ATPase [Planctomycetota bacterium]
MIESLHIRGYRCFSEFALEGLQRVNLLLGKNNCGKTALLEAIELLTSFGREAQSISYALRRRGETFPEDTEIRRGPEFEVGHLFSGHDIGVGSAFEVMAGPYKMTLRCDVIRREPEEPWLFHQQGIEEAIFEWPMALRLSTSASAERTAIPLTPRGGITYDALRSSIRLSGPEDQPRTTLITSDSLSSSAVEAFWKEVALYPEEGLVLDAVRILEPNVERIAYVGAPRRFGNGGRGGMAVKCRGSGKRIPIGSMGDGAWRMLAMALALVRCRGGVLLIDEIDTGLHFTTLASMWHMILEASSRLNVQVFATTHSQDCLLSLSSACHHRPPREVSVHRIEAGKPHSTPFTERELWMAAKRGIEMR